MSLLDNLSATQNTKPETRKCIIARQLDDAKISSEEAEKLDGLLWPNPDDTRVPTTHLARALRKSGIAVSDKSLERHRFFDCSCTR